MPGSMFRKESFSQKQSINLKPLLDFSQNRGNFIYSRVFMENAKKLKFCSLFKGRIHLRIELLSSFPYRETATFKLEEEWTKYCQNNV